jgi:hypothetical protein
MSEPEGERRVKKSEILAIENVKRIADQLRTERNDAQALAQVIRERLERARVLLAEANAVLAATGSNEALTSRISALLAEQH